jgi:hypothetical protein
MPFDRDSRLWAKRGCVSIAVVSQKGGNERCYQTPWRDIIPIIKVLRLRARAVGLVPFCTLSVVHPFNGTLFQCTPTPRYILVRPYLTLLRERYG